MPKKAPKPKPKPDARLKQQIAALPPRKAEGPRLVPVSEVMQRQADNAALFRRLFPAKGKTKTART